jgi:beta-galactosidase
MRNLFTNLGGTERTSSGMQSVCGCGEEHDQKRHFQCDSTEPTGSVEIRERKILVDGEPKMLLAGEVHYFRLAPEDWLDRLDKLQANGLDTVSTYIPWVWHELDDGTVDLDGRTHPQRNLVAFLELCASRGFKVIARPGPFIMAEVKNEGIPYRLYAEPFVQPTTWNGAKVPTRTLDYLAPDFLEAVRGWYGEVMPVIASHLHTRGGSIIAVQLDNEIGMLSWVSNSPELTDVTCEDMRTWSRNRYGDDVASQRMGVDVTDGGAWAENLRSPPDASLPLHQDLGLYSRDRIRRYVKVLRQYAEDNGVSDVLFLINIHGTGGGRGRTYPIGVSQLHQSYEGQAGMTSGSDYYLGDLTVTNVGDLYFCNAFTLSVNGVDQPLTALEFEAGDGNYGDDLGILYTPESIELKTRLCVAQGNRLLNYYLQAGGENPRINDVGDGTARLAFTGQRHGFAAPVSPEGHLNSTYTAITRVVKTIRGVEQILATSTEESDDFAVGFVPDHYMSEYHAPNSAQRTAQIADLERFRGFGPRDVLSRALLLNGYSFPAVNLQTAVPKAKGIVLSTGRTLGREVQQRLAAFVEQGGKLLLVGLLPDQDHDGAPCTVLADALGLKSAGIVEDTMTPKGQYWPSVSAEGWAAPRPEVRVGIAQLLSSSTDAPLRTLLREIASGQPCAVQVSAGHGEAIVMGCDYPADLDLYRAFLSALGIEPRWQLDADRPGVVLTSTLSPAGERLLHAINVAPYKVTFKLKHFGKPVLKGKRLTLQARSGVILPMGLVTTGSVMIPSQTPASRKGIVERTRAVEIADVSGVLILGTLVLESSAEIVRHNRSVIVVQPTQEEEDLVILETDDQVRCTKGKVTRKGSLVHVVMKRSRHGGKPVTIQLS